MAECADAADADARNRTAERNASYCANDDLREQLVDGARAAEAEGKEVVRRLKIAFAMRGNENADKGESASDATAYRLDARLSADVLGLTEEKMLRVLISSVKSDGPGAGGGQFERATRATLDGLQAESALLQRHVDELTELVAELRSTAREHRRLASAADGARVLMAECADAADADARNRTAERNASYCANDDLREQLVDGARAAEAEGKEVVRRLKIAFAMRGNENADKGESASDATAYRLDARLSADVLGLTEEKMLRVLISSVKSDGPGAGGGQFERATRATLDGLQAESALLQRHVDELTELVAELRSTAREHRRLASAADGARVLMAECADAADADARNRTAERNASYCANDDLREQLVDGARAAEAEGKEVVRRLKIAFAMRGNENADKGESASDATAYRLDARLSAVIEGAHIEPTEIARARARHL
ncbi:hypothetical protein KFE25_012167 [Diacronema lutheri]|uniref:Uncharacterized protein n=1 Tax=Diacronema lutheri TaxID=2081491 RepID=A0A8J5XJ96_DIALT|nr:hypothetical protein KFE25_012167 [Diacronema lutheri]